MLLLIADLGKRCPITVEDIVRLPDSAIQQVASKKWTWRGQLETAVVQELSRPESLPKDVYRGQLPEEIGVLNLSTRAANAIRRAGIQTISQLLELTVTRLISFRNLGRISLVELVRKVRMRVLTVARLTEPLSAAVELPPAPWEGQGIEQLGLSTRPFNALRREGISTLGHLFRMRSEQLMLVPYLDVLSFYEVERKMQAWLAENSQGETQEVPPSDDPIAVSSEEPDPGSWTDQPIGALYLSTRSQNGLRRAGVLTVGELLVMTPDDLLQLRNLGRTSQAEIMRVLANMGLSLSGTAEDKSGHGAATAGSPHPEPAPETLEEWLRILLGHLTDRQREVILLRNGLDGPPPQTLEEVGRVYGVTRERIRQIESKALRRIRAGSVKHRLEGLGRLYADLIRDAGGVVSAEKLAQLVSSRLPGSCNPVAFVEFTIGHCASLVHCAKERWALPDTAGEYVFLERAIVQLLSEHEHPLPTAKVRDRLAKRLAETNPHLIEATLISSPKLFVAGGWCALAQWRAGRAPWVLAALYHLGRPSHFTRIAAEVRSLASVTAALADMADHAVHAVLSRLPEVVWTGPGTFALQTWGVEGEVADPPLSTLLDSLDVHTDPVDDIISRIFPDRK